MGTTTTTTRTSTYTGIRYITVPILDVLLLLCFLPTQAIVFPETLSNNKYKNKHDRLSKSNTIISTAPEKGADVLLCLTTFPPQAVEHCEMRAGRTTACCNLVRFGRTRVGIPPISLHQVEMIGYFRFFGEKNSSKQSCNLSYRT